MHWMYYYDPTYILVILGAIICLIASAVFKSTFRRYSQVRSMSGYTGAQAAERMLRTAGITDVRICRVGGNLSDHYDPRNKTVNLSAEVYDSASVAAVGVACHECGHAIQHANGYVPLVIRHAMVPVVNVASTLAWPLVLIGLLFNNRSSMLFIQFGILLFLVSVIFQVVTLPVEFNASHRALKHIKQMQILRSDELPYTRKVLIAAAMTYVASAAAGILQLLRLILLSGGRDRD